MLIRSNTVGTPNEYYADTLLTKPTTSQSAFDNLAAGFATPIVALSDLDSQFSKSPEGQSIHGALQSIEMENLTPGIGFGQKSANYLSNLVGYGLNPLTWLTGEVGGLAAKGISAGIEAATPEVASAFLRKPLFSTLSEPLGKHIPETIGTEAAEKPLSIALMGDKASQAFGIGAGAMAPQAIVDNTDDNGNIEWGGVAREMGEMGAFGIAIGSVPFAWGLMRGKVNRAVGEAPESDVDMEKLNAALEAGHITKDEHQWYTDYLSYQKNPLAGDEGIAQKESLQQRATQIVGKHDINVNSATHEVPFEILNRENMDNVQGATADQVASNLPDNYKTMLSDFIIHNRMDELREAPTTLDGVRGYVDFVNERLGSKDEQIKSRNADLDETMTKGLSENMPLSQKSLVREIRKLGLYAENFRNLAVQIPSRVIDRVKGERQIKQMKSDVKTYQKKMEKTGDASFQKKINRTNRMIDKKEKSLPNFLHPAEELKEIRGSLITDKGLAEGWQKSKQYLRLHDLAEVSPQAKKLLDRIHVEEQYNRQEAFKSLADQVLKLTDSDTPKLANPQNVMDYLKARVEGHVYKEQLLEESVAMASEQKEAPTDVDSQLKDQSEQVNKSGADSLSKEFDASADKFNEFKSSESTFKNLISCVLGSLNG